MLDLTRLVRKPPGRFAVAGFLVEWRKAFGVGFGLLAVAPLAAVAFGVGLPTLGVLLLAGGAGTGVLMVTSRPAGQSLHRYVLTALIGHRDRHEVDGQRVAVFVGLAPARDFADGRVVRLLRSAVQVNPAMVDRRGALHDRPVAGRVALAGPSDHKRRGDR